MPKIDKPATLGPNMYLVKFNNKVLVKYIYYLNASGFIKNRILELSVSAAQPKINKSELRSIKIPLPPLEVQGEIIARIEREQSLVNANNELIQIFEAKIKDEINKLWEE